MSTPVVLSPQTTPPPGALLPGPDPRAPGPGAVLGPHYRGCYGCGDESAEGLGLVGQVGEGLVVTTELVVRRAQQGAPGLAHGGVLAAAADETLGMLLRLLWQPAVTARLETDFVAPVAVGATLRLRAWCTGVAGRKIYAAGEGRLHTDDGPLALRAAALFVAVEPTHFQQHGTGSWGSPGTTLHP